MKTDGLFQIISKTVPVKLNRPVWLLPVGDIHRDNELHAEKPWQEWIQYIRRDRSGALALGMGDYNDFLRAHLRAIMLETKAKGGRQIEDKLRKQIMADVNLVATELKRLPVKWLGLLSGNHYTTLQLGNKRGYETSIHTDSYLAGLLKVPYLGVCAAITLTLVSGPHAAEVRIIAHHGTGSATTVGGSLNRVQRFLSGWKADIALMGDDHKRALVPTGDRLEAVRVGGRDMLTSSTQWIGRTGSFMLGYEPDVESYVTDRALTPTSIGTVELELTLILSPRTGKPVVRIRGLQ